jgi:hypothetical protein
MVHKARDNLGKMQRNGEMNWKILIGANMLALSITQAVALGGLFLALGYAAIALAVYLAFGRFADNYAQNARNQAFADELEKLGAIIQEGQTVQRQLIRLSAPQHLHRAAQIIRDYNAGLGAQIAQVETTGKTLKG